MQKFFIITLFVLLTSITAAAQTTRDEKAEAVKSTDSTPARLVVKTNAQTETERKQVLRVVDGRVLRVGPTTTYLKNGLSTGEVVRLMGKPATITERREGARLFTTYTFSRSEGRVFVAEFENGLLTSSRTELTDTFDRARVE
jgi:hypothetical protein